MKRVSAERYDSREQNVTDQCFVASLQRKLTLVKTTGAIGIGSNQGQRSDLLKQARKLIEQRWNATMRESAIFETEAWGMPEGTPAFLNQVLLFEWSAAPNPETLLEELLDIEHALGRKRTFTAIQTYQSRIIDLDLLFLGNHMHSSDRLELPHHRMISRRFVMEPLSELCPDFILQPWGKSVRDLLDSCPDETPVRSYLDASES